MANSAPPSMPIHTKAGMESLRPPRNRVNARLPYDVTIDSERSENGEIVDVGTIFLTNRECPWQCVMCDLWKNTLSDRVAAGDIPAQIDHAFEQFGQRLKSIRQIKLYNSGSFFDAAAIPVDDHPAIASRLTSFERVIVECHPHLIDERVLSFRNRLKGRLEVAMGLETVHPETLEKLNKGITLDSFRRAAEFLRCQDIALRVFVLVQPPFQPVDEAVEWAVRSADFAFDCGATVVSLIPTRGGNGAMEVLRKQGLFHPPTLATLERSIEPCLRSARGRLFCDLWEARQFADCVRCLEARLERLHLMNLKQTVLPSIDCSCWRSHATGM